MALKIRKDDFDADREVDGIWVNIAPTDDGEMFVWWRDEDPKPFDGERDVGRILVARISNRRAQMVRDKLQQKYRGAMRPGGILPPEIARKVSIEVMSQAVLLDWQNISTESDEPEAYTPERGAALMKESTPFLGVVSDVSTASDLYRATALKEDQENLGNTSSGGPNGAHTSTNSEASE